MRISIKSSLMVMLFSGAHFVGLRGMEVPEVKTMELTEVKCSAASVLSFFINEDGDKCVILGQEASGCDKDTYDDFGGKLERCDKKPAVSAAREFWEEAILLYTIGMVRDDVVNYIDEYNSNTETVIAFKTTRQPYHYMITYITDFTPYANVFFENFYKVRNTQKLSHEFREKNSIAIVKWEDLKNAIASTSGGNVHVYAKVLQNNGEKIYQKIPLRRIFSSKMRLFFQDKKYRAGSLEKIRFYSYDFLKAQKCTNG